MSTTSITRFRAALRVPKEKISPLLGVATVIYTAMFAQPVLFPAPTPALALVLSQITSLEAAQRVVTNGLRGASVGLRNTARDALWVSLLSLKAYVQSLADASLEDGFNIVKASGFSVVSPRSVSKPILAARVTGISGGVELIANAGSLKGGSNRHAAYNWQYSLDGGHTWVTLPGTPTASTTVSGLPPLTNCSFRVSVTLSKVMQPWSQAVTIPVH